MTIQDLKVGDIFQMEGLDINGNIVQCDATLRSYQGMNKYVVESDGITIKMDGEETVTKIKEEKKEIAKETAEENNEEDSNDKSDYYTEKFDKQNEQEGNMGMSLPEAVKTSFKKYFDFKGRASRSEYWYFTLFILIGYIIGFTLGFIAPVFFIINGVFFLLVIIPWITVAARRLHDINKSGWLQTIPIPAGILEFIFAEYRQETLEIIFLIIGLFLYVYLIVLLCTAGDNKQNRFGKNPLK